MRLMGDTTGSRSWGTSTCVSRDCSDSTIEARNTSTPSSACSDSINPDRSSLFDYPGDNLSDFPGGNDMTLKFPLKLQCANSPRKDRERSASQPRHPRH